MSYTISGGTCAGSALAAKSSCTVIVELKPAAPVGPKPATLTVGGASASLTGVALTPSTLKLAPTSNDFGSLATGEPSLPFTFTVTNSGGTSSGTLTVTVSDKTDYTIGGTCNGHELASGGAPCTVTVVFNPGATGAKPAILTVAPATGTPIMAMLTGTGRTPAQLTLTPDSNDFAPVAVGSAGTEAPFTIANNGESPTGTLTIALTGTDASSFKIGSKTCSTTLDAKASCQVGVQFKPGSVGVKSAMLSVSANPGGDVATTLGGTAGNALGVTTVAGTTVITHMSDGTVFQTVTAQDDGTAHVIVPAGGMVTVAIMSPFQGLDYYLATVVDVFGVTGIAPGGQLDVPSPPPGTAQPGPTVGQVTVDAPGAYSGASSYLIAGATCDVLDAQMLPDTASSVMFAIDDACVASSSSSLDVVAVASNGTARLAYSFGSTTFNGGDATVTLPPWTAARSIDVTATHVPGSAVTLVGVAEFSYGTAPDSEERQDWSTSGLAFPIKLHVPGDSFANPVSVVLAAQRDISIPQAQVDVARQTITRVVPSPYSPVTVDMGALLPEIQTVTVDTADATRPSASWTVGGSLAAAAYGRVLFLWGSPGASRAWFLAIPVSSSVQAPGLPSEMAEWTTGAGSAFLGGLWFDTDKTKMFPGRRRPAAAGKSTSIERGIFSP
jgi:hypothetical protein